MLTLVTPPCCLTISQSENCAQADHILCDLPLLAFKKALPKLLGELKAFQGMSHLISFHGLAINLSLLQTLTFQFVWSHCVCVNN